MIFAIVNEGKVVNIAEGNHPLSVDWIQVDNGVPVGIGDTYDGMAFYSPEGQMRMSYVQTKTQNQVDQAHGQISDLETAFDALMGGVSVALGL